MRGQHLSFSLLLAAAVTVLRFGVTLGTETENTKVYEIDVFHQFQVPQTSASPANLQPARNLSETAFLALTWFYEVSYSVLFLFILSQLWIIYYLNHKLLSYQTVFLYLNLFGSALRVLLFSFYFHCNSVEEVDNSNIIVFWLLFCLPICFQFATVLLLGNFFLLLYFKTLGRIQPAVRYNYKFRIRLFCSVALCVFVSTNLVCGLLSRTYVEVGGGNGGVLSGEPSVSEILVLLRVMINDTLFIVCGGILSFCIYKLSKINAAQSVLEGKGMSVCQASIMCGCIILLYTSRALYNIAAVLFQHYKMPGFGYNWTNITDQADFGVSFGKGFAFLQYGVVLFLWEFLPTSLVAIFFRVRLPDHYWSCSCCKGCRHSDESNQLSSGAHTVSTNISRSYRSTSSRPTTARQSVQARSPSSHRTSQDHAKFERNVHKVQQLSERSPLVHGQYSNRGGNLNYRR